MPRLAFSTNAFKKSSLESAIDAIAQVGYGGVELMADVPHALPGHVSPARLRDLKKRIADHGQVVSNVNAFTLFACGDTYHPTWIEDDAKLRQTRIEHTRACLRLAAEVGAKTISLQPGGPLIGTSISRNEAANRYADGLNAVLDDARSLNITLGIEPEPGLFIQSADEYLKFKNAYFKHEPLVRMNCDIGHLFCVGDDPAAVIRAMPQQVAHVHLEDIGDNRVHQHLTPGKGVIDFESVFSALDAIGYGGWVTVELYPYETTAAGVAQAAFTHLSRIARAELDARFR
jgi:sugar phosphate isomerase/epimerase